MINFVRCEWQQVSDLMWTVDSWGLDHCRVQWCGRRDKKEQFESTLQRFAASISDYPSMRLTGWSDAGGTKNLPIVELEFVGFRSGTIPPPKYVDSKSQQSASGSGYDAASQQTISGNVLYLSPRTTWTWFETTKPASVPRYCAVNDFYDPRTLDNLLHYSVQADNGDTLYDVPYSSLITLLNSLGLSVKYQEYTREEILPEALWACTCVAQVTLNG